MIKDKEWLKSKLRDIRERNDRGNNFEGAATINLALRLIDQLDEPETLSEEWIDKKKVFLGQETDETDFGRPVYGVEESELLNLLVPKQEELVSKTDELKPVVPQFVAGWIEGNKQFEEKWNGYSKEDAMNDTIHFTIYGLFADYPVTNRKRVNNWLDVDRGNYFKLVNAVRYGYKVEKEQRYRVEDDESPLLIKVKGKISRYNNTNYYGNIEHTYELTEQEIKDYDERYFAFAKPVEEEK